MASKKILAQLNLQAESNLSDPTSGFVGFAAKSDGLYQKIGTGADQKLLTEVSFNITQAAHGFAVGQAVKLSGSSWVKAKADTYANAGAMGVVCGVVDANNFSILNNGFITGSYTSGADYFLSTVTAGGLMIHSTPESWTAGQVRQYIGTGTASGLLVDIDAGDEITASVFKDIYVSGMSFNATSRVLTLSRTESMPDISLAIPFPPEDLGYEFRDVLKGTAQTYVLDMKASWGYSIQGIVYESDGTLTGISVKINSKAVTGLGSLSVGTKAETAASGANVVVAGDVVTINTTASFTGTPTMLRIKLKIIRS